VLEPPKTSRRGDCFVFQIIAGKYVSWRLSCFDRKTATKWVVTLVGVCAYYRSLNCPGPVSSSGRCGMTNHAPATGSVAAHASSSTVSSGVSNSQEEHAVAAECDVPRAECMHLTPERSVPPPAAFQTWRRMPTTTRAHCQSHWFWRSLLSIFVVFLINAARHLRRRSLAALTDVCSLCVNVQQLASLSHSGNLQ